MSIEEEKGVQDDRANRPLTKEDIQLAQDVADYLRNPRKISPALVRLVERLSKSVAWAFNRKDLADDLAQEFWIMSVNLLTDYDSKRGTVTDYVRGCLRNVVRSISRKNPVPVEADENVEDIHTSMSVLACAEESLDRKLAISAIQRKLSKGDAMHISPLPQVRLKSAEDKAGQEPVPNLLLGEGKPKKPKKPPRTKNADHLRIKEIRLALDMTQNEFSSAIGLIPATLVSYEQGQTQKVPADVMARAEEMMASHGEVMSWRERFDKRSMLEILNGWAEELGADPNDLATMAALTGTVTSTISRWRSGETRPSLREIVAYDKNIKLNVARLRKSGLLIESKITTEIVPT